MNSLRMGNLQPLVFLFCVLYHAAGVRSLHSFQSIYAFGDSLTDTGNALLLQRSVSVDAVEGHLPYGETYFLEPTGRFSDGRLLVDFLASRVGVSHFLLPYLGLDNATVDSKAQSLVNFAVGGATAQNVDYLNVTYNVSVSIPYSIDKQLQWFSSLPVSEDKDALSKALIYFGEIGVNDYNAAFVNGFSIDFVISNFVPKILNVIQNALEYLIESGAKYLVVEGGYPVGCSPIYEVLYPNATTNEYGCVKKLQKLTERHEERLKELVHNLTTKYGQDVHIVFFDHVKAFVEVLKHPSKYGFTNTTDGCFEVYGSTDVTELEACRQPSTYVNWDGIHFTDALHKVLLHLFYAEGFVKPYPNFLHCHLEHCEV